ncbi:extracellular solute-binding protein [Parafilimonas terrae]|uniref:Carbohydrate ABC transporter substrate-binding protein, CUT1 family n=1 Tax=Parafilimonas terrae TaxID=1465490 RepID=A0A1I5TNZ9_9BACT|nr:extracellular solute-binding protein [Parafilimonas terrae]SFP84327.1 carbohydrate ABC transporter substrate-binding protein, CUT1 family [Parafilimonas terrae]
MTELKGITWNHSRGFTPLQACCQRYQDKYKNIQVEWHKRSLQAFADFSVEDLSKQYDVLIIDHPSVGEAFHSNCFIHFNEYINKDVLNELAANSTGLSYQSYTYKNAQLALPVDAAAPASSLRKDLFLQHNEAVPQTWEQLIALADKGKVALPAIPIDMLMNFYMLCIACGNTPFSNNKEVIDDETGENALQLMAGLYSRLDEKMFHCNPIAIAELMSLTDEYWYCPFSYGYSNYTRKNYAEKLLTYNDVVSYSGAKLCPTLGGTGIAVSAHSKHITEAVHIAMMLASESIQSGLYVEHGGQPAHIKAWQSDYANNLTNNYFIDTLPALQRAWLRPRYHGYLQFQDEAGYVLHEHLHKQTSSSKNIMPLLNKLYRKSQANEKSITV